MELTLVDYSCVKFLPSEISAASLYIAIKATSNSENDDCSATKWTTTLQYYSMYSETKLLPCAKHIAFLITKTLDGSSKLQVSTKSNKPLPDLLFTEKSLVVWEFTILKCIY